MRLNFCGAPLAAAGAAALKTKIMAFLAQRGRAEGGGRGDEAEGRRPPSPPRRGTRGGAPIAGASRRGTSTGSPGPPPLPGAGSGLGGGVSGEPPPAARYQRGDAPGRNKAGWRRRGEQVPLNFMAELPWPRGAAEHGSGAGRGGRQAVGLY